MSSTRLTINLAKFGMPATFTWYTGTTCPCTTAYGSYSPQWHADNPTAANCSGKMLITTTTHITDVNVTAGDIRALTNTTALTAKMLDSIGLINKVDLVVVGCANSKGEYVNCTGHDEHDSYWTINKVDYVTKLEFVQLANVDLGDVFILSRKS